MKTAISLFFALAFALLGSISVQAQTLIGSEYGGGAIYNIDGAAGTATTIGGGTTSLLPGLAYNPNSGTLFGTDENNLYIVDQSDGTTSLVGAHGVQSVTGLTFNSSYTQLYTIGYDGILYSINPASGAQTAIGPLGSSPNDILELATNSAGTVYGTGTSNNLYTVNTSTGVATSLGLMSGTTGAGLTAIAFDENDTLFAIDTLSDRLVTVDVGTRVVTFVGAAGIGSDVRGLAVVIDGVASGEPPRPVPALGTVGLVSLSIILLMVGLVGTRRRRSI